MNDDKFHDKPLGPLQGALRDYNDPPETPREAMWARIEARREAERVVYKEDKPSFWSFLTLRQVWWPAATVAVLVLGIVIGRFVMPTNPGSMNENVMPAESQLATTDDQPTESPAGEQPSPKRQRRSTYQLAAVPVLNQAELLLIQYKLGESSNGEGQTFPQRAAGLLNDTRLLLDSPAADDPELASLLTDLELILARIVRFAADDSMDDRELIDESMQQQSILPRLRSKAPSSSLADYI